MRFLRLIFRILYKALFGGANDNRSKKALFFDRLFFYSNFMAFVGSMCAIIIEGSTSIATEIMNIATFIGSSHHVNIIGTRSI